MPTSPIHSLVLSPAPDASSHFSPSHQPRESTSSTASRALAGSAPPPSQSAIAFNRLACKIIRAEAAVAIVVDVTHYSGIGHGGF